MNGLDVSHHQGRPQWGAVLQDDFNVEFVILKATEGLDWRDTQYERNAAHCRLFRVMYSAYHYARPAPDRDPKAEARFFHSVVSRTERGQLPLALDLEEHGGLEPWALTEWALQFLEELERLDGRTPLIYTYTHFLATRLDWSQLDRFPKWLARYSDQAPEGHTIWQYTSSGQVAGIDGRVDANVADPVRLYGACLSGTPRTDPPRTEARAWPPAAPAGSVTAQDPRPKSAEETAGIAWVQDTLAKGGWPIAVDGVYGPQTKAAVTDFQRGWIFHELAQDGTVGARTSEALRGFRANGYRLSEHFTAREFASKGNGWIKVNRDLLINLEIYRARYVRGPVTIVSGYRDPVHNQKVGGASESQHLYGNAADLVKRVHVDHLRPWWPGGIGYSRSSGLVRHLDVGPRREWTYP